MKQEIKYWLVSLLMSVVLLTPFTLFGQTSRRLTKLFNEANTHFDNQRYEEAITGCQKIVMIDTLFVDARLLLADIYNEIGDVRSELEQLNHALLISQKPLIKRRLGEGYFSIGLYSEALEFFKQYLLHLPDDSEGRKAIERRVESSLFGIKAMADSGNYLPVRISSAINSKDDEYWPGMTVDQQQLIFTRLIREEGRPPHEDIYVSRKTGSEGWETAVPIESINTGYNEGAQSVSADGNFLFFTGCNRPDGFGSCDIYLSVKGDSGWSRPRNAGKMINSNYWEGHPSLSSDGRFLYFSSNRPGGVGGKDLWRAELTGFDKNGEIQWRAPENLGDKINTPGDEISPFIHAGNRQLYFVSDYHIGMGKNDIFVSEILSDSIFSEPTNLGYPINTANDELGLFITADGKSAYFATSRDSLHGLDIYMFELEEKHRPDPATYIRIAVHDLKTDEPLETTVQIEDNPSFGKDLRVVQTDSNGELLICLPIGKSYGISVSKEHYLYFSDYFDLTDTRQYYDPYLLDIALTPIEPGAEMHLYNIYFETDSSRILSDSEYELRQLLKFLGENSNLKVEIQGHTDSSGSAEKNETLSSLRADAIAEYLIMHGIEQQRLSRNGYGARKPVAPNDTPENRRLNRRTSIRILEG